MKTIVKEFYRKDLFDHYHSKTNPFIIVTKKVDITNLLKYCKESKSHYATIAYVLHSTLLQIDNFKYRYEDGDIFYYDELALNFVENVGEKIAWFNIEYNVDFKSFIKEYLYTKGKIREKKEHIMEVDLSSKSEIWYSCNPWYDFESLVTPFDKSCTVPQLIWGKFTKKGRKTYVALYLQVHHGFMDGNHLGKFFSLLDENIKNCKGLLK